MLLVLKSALKKIISTLVSVKFGVWALTTIFLYYDVVNETTFLAVTGLFFGVNLAQHGLYRNNGGVANSNLGMIENSNETQSDL